MKPDPHALPAPQESPGDEQYLRHVTDLGERRSVVAHTAIFTRNGVKLIDSGMTVDGRMFERLAQHHLLPPIDECLSVEGAVTVDEVKQGVSDLLAGDSAFSMLLPGDTARREVLRAFEYLPLAPQLAFKLTVAREQRPELWRHSLQVALVAAILAAMERSPMSDMVDAALAGLSHDLGLLHIAPEVLADGAAMSVEYRRHLYSHPLIAKLMLARLPRIASCVVNAVADHHEREDGSGYPRGIRGRHIDPLGQLLAVAELVGSVLAERSSLPVVKRLSIVLRLNHHKFAPRFFAHLVRLAEQSPSPSVAPTPEGVGASLGIMVRLAKAIEGWRAVRGENGGSLEALMDERINDLDRCLAEAGVDLHNWTTISAELDDDPHACAELQVLAAEGDWQLSAIIHEAMRRQAAEAERTSSSVDAWLALVKRQPELAS